MAAESGPASTDHQLRRISVQLRSLLVEGSLQQCWRLLTMEPKQPIINAPRLRPNKMDKNAVALAGGGTIGPVRFANISFRPGVALSADEVKQEYEEGKADMEFPFRLTDYLDSCSIFINGKSISRRQVIAYVANKKGGAHLDHTRKKDDDAYRCLDSAANLIRIGTSRNPANGTIEGGRNAIYAELLSVGQHVSGSSDIQRLVAACNSALGHK